MCAYEEVTPPNHCLDCLIPTELPTGEHKLHVIHAQVNAFLHVLLFLDHIPGSGCKTETAKQMYCPAQQNRWKRDAVHANTSYNVITMIVLHYLLNEVEICF